MRRSGVHVHFLVCVEHIRSCRAQVLFALLAGVRPKRGAYIGSFAVAISGCQLIHQLLLPVLMIDIVHNRTPFLKWLYTDLDLTALCRFHYIRQDRRILCLQDLGIGSCSGFGDVINEKLI